MDPANRRFHSQTIGCPCCGPKTRFLGRAGNPELTEDPVRRALTVLLSGGVLAIKGTGGYHLACDALNREAIGRIRVIKNRPEKPLAVMAGSLAGLGRIARIHFRAATLLESPERPIVLLPMLERGDLPYDIIAPGLDRIGLFLPSTPIQHLLFGPGQENPLALVMTSANIAGWPITALESEVLEHFSGKVDGFLVHDRPVFHRLDDSLLLPEEKGPILLRRSRGWLPSVFSVGRPGRSGMDILAIGGHLNVAPCRIRDGQALVLPHLGDLDGEGVREACRTFLQKVVMEQGGCPTHLACDLHPDFPSTGMALEWGQNLGIPVVPVQHHHAHIASVMADRGLSGPVLGLALDGFGLGTDGTPWGGELLVVDTLECRRLGHFRPIPLPGGDRASSEPWRMGVAALSALGRGKEASGIFSSPHVPALVEALEKPGRALFQSTTSAGRLFDAAYALLGGKESLSYEGQGAMEMEGWARKADRMLPGEQFSKIAANGRPAEEGYRLSGEGVLDFLPLLGRLVGVREKERGASFFHGILALGLRDWILWAREQTGLGTVLLSGGVFQNRILVDSLRRLLERDGIRVVEPLRVPVNDGGLALGQAWVVHSRVLYGRDAPGVWKEI
jgi:hydrogenase maturation protein HypF